MRLVGLLIAITVLSVAHDTEVNDSDNDPTNLLHPSPTPVGTERVRTNTPTPAPAPTLTVTPVPTPAPTLIPTPTIMGGSISQLGLPDGLSTRYDGCSPTYGCSVRYNYYDAGSHEVVLVDTSQSDLRRIHETCHAHQHWSINGGLPLALADYDLGSWYGTAEATSYEAIAGHDWPWPTEFSYQSVLEDFAEACAWWYVRPSELYTLSLARYEWMRSNLP